MRPSTLLRLGSTVVPRALGLHPSSSPASIVAPIPSEFSPRTAYPPAPGSSRRADSFATAATAAARNAQAEGGKAKDEGKKPLSSFFRFAAQERPKVVKENPGLKVSEVGKILGERWRALTDAERQVYVEAYKAEKLLYDQRKQEKK